MNQNLTVVILGSTGSIGTQGLDVIARHRDRFTVVGLAAGGAHVELLAKQAAEFQVPQVAVYRTDVEPALREALDRAGAVTTRIQAGPDAVEAVAGCGAAVVLNGITGSIGLKPSIAALKAGSQLALANKESVVAGGNLLFSAQTRDNQINPVDSEHSAIWQCLNFDRAAPFSRLILTASGGALRDVPPEKLAGVTAAQALAHPNWNMGVKITVDCATMLNKGFEVIEAMHLYAAPLDRIEVLVHRESVVHSMVEFADGAVLAQLGVPSMELPIQLALTYPERLDCALPRLNLAQVGALHFESVDLRRYPCFALALECAKKGGMYPCALNAAGEVAVAAFLRGQIKYTQIAEIIEGALVGASDKEPESYAALEQADRLARERAFSLLP